MDHKILILDFGSQYTQLIARRIRELNVYCEIFPYNNFPQPDNTVKGVILSGSPASVHDRNAPRPDLSHLKGKIPMLGICYGAQILVHHYGGKVLRSDTREYGRARLIHVDATDKLLKEVDKGTQVWMSHADTITKLPPDYTITGSTADVKAAAYHSGPENNW